VQQWMLNNGDTLGQRLLSEKRMRLTTPKAISDQFFRRHTRCPVTSSAETKVHAPSYRGFDINAIYLNSRTSKAAKFHRLVD
jgi:hypothetical protein